MSSIASTQNSTNNSGFPDLVSIQPFATPISSVGTWAISTDPDLIKNGVIDNASSNAQNDEIEYNVTLGPGTWAFDQVYVTFNIVGILHLEIDGTEVGTIDWYSASISRNVTKSITGITIAEGGMKAVTLKVATKNASATDYYMGFMSMQFRRTGP